VQKKYLDSGKERVAEETWKKIEDRRDIKRKLLTCKAEELQREYNIKAREVKRSARADQRKWTSDLAEEAQRATNENDTQTISRCQIPRNRPIRSKAGRTLLTNTKEQIERWHKHFSKVLKGIQCEGTERQDGDEEEEMESWKEDNRINTAEPTKEEIKITIKALKAGKAPGIDNTRLKS
jgi:hypothetical protein